MLGKKAAADAAIVVGVTRIGVKLGQAWQRLAGLQLAQRPDDGGAGQAAFMSSAWIRYGMDDGSPMAPQARAALERTTRSGLARARCNVGSVSYQLAGR